MYLERATLQKIERLLLLGSVLTLLFGLVLLVTPRRVMVYADLGGVLANRLDPGVSVFIQLAGLLVALLGAAYAMTLLDREKSRAILTLGCFQKFAAAVLLAVVIALGRLPLFYVAVVAFDGTMALLFFLHLRGARTDGWT